MNNLIVLVVILSTLTLVVCDHESMDGRKGARTAPTKDCKGGKCKENSSTKLNGCPTNEKPTNCFNECGRNCKDSTRMACDNKCLSDHPCTCKDGYLRDSTTGRCVLRKDCTTSPDTVPVINSDMYCGPNEEFNSCGLCDPTCNDLSPVCKQSCQPQCNCIFGYVRNSLGKCVSYNECK